MMLSKKILVLLIVLAGVMPINAGRTWFKKSVNPPYYNYVSTGEDRPNNGSINRRDQVGQEFIRITVSQPRPNCWQALRKFCCYCLVRNKN